MGFHDGLVLSLSEDTSKQNPTQLDQFVMALRATRYFRFLERHALFACLSSCVGGASTTNCDRILSVVSVNLDSLALFGRHVIFPVHKSLSILSFFSVQ